MRKSYIISLMLRTIPKKELVHAQIAILFAIGLQLMVWKMNHQLAFILTWIIVFEVAIALLIGFTANIHKARIRSLHHTGAIALIALMSAANIASLIYTVNSLIFGHDLISGIELLSSAIAIFLTNIIVFALWYWEIDSPGLTRTRWSKNDKDFQFIQQDMKGEFPEWKPEFVDYLFISVINAFNGATISANPLTHQAKLLMAGQSLVSIFTLALLIARSVSIFGQS